MVDALLCADNQKTKDFIFIFLQIKIEQGLRRTKHTYVTYTGTRGQQNKNSRN